jgi:hypothetical protein
MSRIADLGAWIAGAIVSSTGYWYVVVYLLDEFNHGYGRRNWFQLSLYLSMIAVVVGLVGYAVASGIWRRSSRAASAFIAGIAFTAGQLAFGAALRSLFPDSDMALAGLAGALVIGALSTLVARPKPA